jgi:transcriptional regulator with XRE-family HTH domain
MQTIGEKLNSLRMDRHVSVAQLTQIPTVTRTKYYRFLANHTGLTINDVYWVMAYLGEPINSMDETNPWMQFAIFLAEHTQLVSQVVFEELDNFIAASDVPDVTKSQMRDLAALRYLERPDQNALRRVFDLLRSTDYMTLVDVLALRVIGPYLKLEQIRPLFAVFAKSIAANRYRMDILWQRQVDGVLTQAVDRIMTGDETDIKEIACIVEAFLEHRTQVGYFEFFVKRRFVALLKETLSRPIKDRDWTVFMALASDLAELTLDGQTIIPTDFLSNWLDQLCNLRQLPVLPDAESLDEIDFARELPTFMKQIRQFKHLQLKTLPLFGLSASTVRRLEKGITNIYVKPALNLLLANRMLIADLYPATTQWADSVIGAGVNLASPELPSQTELAAEFAATGSLGVKHAADLLWLEKTASSVPDAATKQRYQSLWREIAGYDSWGEMEFRMATYTASAVDFVTEPDVLFRTYQKLVGQRYYDLSPNASARLWASLYVATIIESRHAPLLRRIAEADRLSEDWPMVGYSAGFTAFTIAMTHATIKAAVLKDAAALADVRRFLSVATRVFTPAHKAALFDAFDVQLENLPKQLNQDDGWR